MNRAPTMRFGCHVWVEHTRRRFIPVEEKDGSKKVCVWSSASYSWNRNELTVSLCIGAVSVVAGTASGTQGPRRVCGRQSILQPVRNDDLTNGRDHRRNSPRRLIRGTAV